MNDNVPWMEILAYLGASVCLVEAIEKCLELYPNMSAAKRKKVSCLWIESFENPVIDLRNQSYQDACRLYAKFSSRLETIVSGKHSARLLKITDEEAMLLEKINDRRKFALDQISDLKTSLREEVLP